MTDMSIHDGGHVSLVADTHTFPHPGTPEAEAHKARMAQEQYGTAAHRLMEDFANHDGIRFVCDNGDVRDTTDHRLVAAINRHVETGDTWKAGEE